MAEFTFHPTMVRRTPLRPRPLATNFPSVPAVKGALGTQRRPPSNVRRRTATSLLATAMRDAKAFKRRVKRKEAEALLP